MNTMNENLEMLKEVANEGYENARQLGEINLRIWNKMLEKQTDALGFWLDAGTKQLELATTAKSYREYLETQSQLTRELNESLITGGRESVKLAGEVRDEYRSWMESATEKAANRAKEATAQVQQ